MADVSLRSAPIRELAASAEIILEGSVGPNDAAALKQGLDRSIGPDIRFVSILMGGVNAMSSAGFELFSACAAALEKRAGSLVLVGVQPKIKLVFINLGMDRLFRFETSDEEARAFLRTKARGDAPPAHMVPLDGTQKGAPFAVGEAPLLIGRDPKSAIVVRDPRAEQRHAEIYRQGADFRVRDLGTKFGTFVGDRRVQDEPLRAGDIVKVGNVRLAYHPPGVTPAKC